MEKVHDNAPTDRDPRPQPPNCAAVPGTRRTGHGLARIRVSPRSRKREQRPAAALPAWLTFPEQQWQRITPAKAGIDTVAYEKLLAQSQIGPKGWGGTQPDNRQWGAVLTRGGYLVQTWGDPAFKTQSASLGKCITRALIGISAERGRLKLDEPISTTWTGRGQLSHEHKCLDQGYHARLTWRQLINHQGGFVLESGYHWPRVPSFTA